MRRFLKGCAVVLAILILSWGAGRYGWKLFQFALCDSTGIDGITVTDQSVEIKGFYPGSFPEGYIGYVAKQEGDILYFGVKYSPIFGVFETGSFTEEIHTTEPIHQIYLITDNDERLIWDSYGVLESRIQATGENDRGEKQL